MNRKSMLIEEMIIAVLLFIMVLMVMVQVLSRYIIHESLSYTEELVRYGFVWMTFLGAAAAAYRKRHLSMAVTLKIIPKQVRRSIHRVIWFGALCFAGVLFIYGVRVVQLQFNTHQTTAALGFPMWIIGLAIPVSSTVLVLRLVMKAVSKRKDI